MIVPVVFTSITVSIFDSSKLRNKLVLKTIIIFVLMFIATFILSSIVVLIVNPGSNFVFDNVEWSGTTTSINL